MVHLAQIAESYEITGRPLAAIFSPAYSKLYAKIQLLSLRNAVSAQLKEKIKLFR